MKDIEYWEDRSPSLSPITLSNRDGRGGYAYYMAENFTPNSNLNTSMTPNSKPI